MIPSWVSMSWQGMLRCLMSVCVCIFVSVVLSVYVALRLAVSESGSDCHKMKQRAPEPPCHAERCLEDKWNGTSALTPFKFWHGLKLPYVRMLCHAPSDTTSCTCSPNIILSHNQATSHALTHRPNPRP